MSQDLQKAKQYLHTQGYTFVAVKNEDLFVSQKRGVAPLLEQIDSNTLLNGFSVADKVVGKASAFLYLLLQPAAVYTDLISLPAVSYTHLDVYKRQISCPKISNLIRS